MLSECDLDWLSRGASNGVTRRRARSDAPYHEWLLSSLVNPISFFLSNILNFFDRNEEDGDRQDACPTADRQVGPPLETEVCFSEFSAAEKIIQAFAGDDGAAVAAAAPALFTMSPSTTRDFEFAGANQIQAMVGIAAQDGIELDASE